MFSSTTVGTIPLSREQAHHRPACRTDSRSTTARWRGIGRASDAWRLHVGGNGSFPIQKRPEPRPRAEPALDRIGWSGRASGFSDDRHDRGRPPACWSRTVVRMPSSRPMRRQDERELADLRQGHRDRQRRPERIAASPTRSAVRPAACRPARRPARRPPAREIESATPGSSSMPTDTKNSTANASRIGNASDAARRL